MKASNTAHPAEALSLEPACKAMAGACACYHLRRAARAVTRHYDERLAEVGLRSTQLTLLSAVMLRGSLNMTDLGAVMALEQSSLSRNVALLRQRGLLRTVPGASLREVGLVVTKKGERTLEQALPIWTELQKELEGLLAPDPLHRALDVVRRIGELNAPFPANLPPVSKTAPRAARRR